MTAFLFGQGDYGGNGASRPDAGGDPLGAEERKPEPTRVLIAEDEWIVAAALRRQVQAHGYDVVGTVGTGTEVQARCKPDDPTVVLMAIQMPEMDGLTATRQLMATCPQPVAVITGNATLRQAAEQAGAMEYVVKPVLPHQIPDIITRTQQRFGWFMRVRRETPDSEEALEAWQVVQQALRHLVTMEQVSEGQAFARIEELAKAERLSLWRAAARMLATGA
jgi:AmiR/NasT family two-component response regulator